MFTIPYVSCVTCHVSNVMCHMSHVTCHMSHVMCHMSHVRCHMSKVKKEKKKKEKREKNLQSGGASRWRVCYQRGLPGLVFSPYIQFSIKNIDSPLLPLLGPFIESVAFYCLVRKFFLSRQYNAKLSING